MSYTSNWHWPNEVKKKAIVVARLNGLGYFDEEYNSRGQGVNVLAAAGTAHPIAV